jgi:hypothetical protein
MMQYWLQHPSPQVMMQYWLQHPSPQAMMQYWLQHPSPQAMMQRLMQPTWQTTMLLTLLTSLVLKNKLLPAPFFASLLETPAQIHPPNLPLHHPHLIALPLALPSHV